MITDLPYIQKNRLKPTKYFLKRTDISKTKALVDQTL